MSDESQLQIALKFDESLVISSRRSTLIARGRRDAAMLSGPPASEQEALGGRFDLNPFNWLADLESLSPWAQTIFLCCLAHELIVSARLAGDLGVEMTPNLRVFLGYSELQHRVIGSLRDRILGTKLAPLDDIIQATLKFAAEEDESHRCETPLGPTIRKIWVEAILKFGTEQDNKLRFGETHGLAGEPRSLAIEMKVKSLSGLRQSVILTQLAHDLTIWTR